MQTEEKIREKTLNETAAFCQALYKNVKMGSESLLTLLPKINDNKLHEEVSVLCNLYENFASRIRKILTEQNADYKEEPIVTRVSAKIGITMNTALDNTSSHIAQMVTEGANIGVDDATKLCHEYEKKKVSDESLTLCRDLIGFQREVVERMRAYL